MIANNLRFIELEKAILFTVSLSFTSPALIISINYSNRLSRDGMKQRFSLGTFNFVGPIFDVCLLESFEDSLDIYPGHLSELGIPS